MVEQVSLGLAWADGLGSAERLTSSRVFLIYLSDCETGKEQVIIGIQTPLMYIHGSGVINGLRFL
jgi:hypothetical protein